MQTLAPISIDHFLSLIQKGIDAWTEAGKVLSELLERDPSAKVRILKAAPFLTDSILDSFVKIGRKELFPYLLIDDFPAASALARFPFEMQKKLYNAEVDVVKKTRDGIVTEKVNVKELTFSQLHRVFDGARTIPAEEQARAFRVSVPIREVAHTAPVDESDGEEDGIFVEGTDPIEKLKKELTYAQNALLRARSILADAELRGDDKITNALREIGQLRFDISHLEPA